jgi:hypothetical protein
MSNAHTPGPWVLEIRKGLGEACRDATVAEIGTPGKYRGNVAYLQSAEHIDGIAKDELIANARLIAAAPDMLAALRLHQAWADSERTGPNYGEQTRDTHPNGEEIWRIWWQGNLDLCDRANSATLAVIAKTEGRT